MTDNLKAFLVKLPVLSWAYRQGGIDAFPLASKDIWATMEDEVDRRAEELAKHKMNGLLSIVDEKSIVSFDKRGLVYIGGEVADQGLLANLKSEAEFFVSSDLWRILNETPKRLAEQAMFVEGDSIDYMKKGRAMLYLLSTQKKIVDTFRLLASRA